MLTRCSILLCVLLVALLSGCGGGDSHGSYLNGAGRTGSISIAFRWPAVTKAIPTNAQSLVFSITGGPTELKKTTNRPVLGQTTATGTTGTTGTMDRVDFFGVYTGTLTLTVTAYPQVNGQGNPIAMGKTALNIQPGRHSDLSLTLEGLPAYMTLSSSSMSVEEGSIITLSTNVYDNMESLILLPVGSIIWSTSDANLATISQDGVLTGRGRGIVTVTATIKDTQISATVDIEVIPASVVPIPNAAPLADAIIMNETYGAFHAYWQTPPTKVVAILIYRSTSPTVPVGIVKPDHSFFLDSGLSLQQQSALENTTAHIVLDPATGNVTAFDTATTYDATADNMLNLQQTLTDATFDVICRRTPLVPGYQTGYQLRWLYKEQVAMAQTRATQYVLKLSNLSSASSTMTMIMPPVLITTNGVEPTNGDYQCSTITGANYCTLQVDTNPNFTSAIRVDQPVTGTGIVTLNMSRSTIIGMLNITQPTTIYWRMGARNSGEPLPTTAINVNYAGWVYSETRSFAFNPVLAQTRNRK